MSYFKALPSCKEKILSWDRKDFHALAASMDQEEIRSMVRELYEECPQIPFENRSAENVVYCYLSLLAAIAEMENESEAAELYEMIFSI